METATWLGTQPNANSCTFKHSDNALFKQRKRNSLPECFAFRFFFAPFRGSESGPFLYCFQHNSAWLSLGAAKTVSPSIGFSYIINQMTYHNFVLSLRTTGLTLMLSPQLNLLTTASWTTCRKGVSISPESPKQPAVKGYAPAEKMAIWTLWQSTVLPQQTCKLLVCSLVKNKFGIFCSTLPDCQIALFLACKMYVESCSNAKTCPTLP